jgi:peptidoglycan hydrolase-like protein with peptidoglycan-binding domain
METFAFIQAAVSYEDPNPAPEIDLALNLPNAAVIGLASTAIAAAVMTGAPQNATAATAPLSQGSAGAEVEAVQKALGMEADGQFGAKTEAAVTDFQIRQGLKQIDGTVGPETAAALGLNEQYEPTGTVATRSGVGLHVRSGPGLDYRVIGGAGNGAFLFEIDDSVVVNDGFHWRPLAGQSERWVATNYTFGNNGNDYFYEFPASFDNGSFEEEVSFNDDGIVYYDDYYEQEVGFDGGAAFGGTVSTNTGIGLNIRSGPGLENSVIGGATDGTFVPTGEGTIYEDGYYWTRVSTGGWAASDYLDGYGS